MKTIKIILLLLLVCANVGAQRVEDGYFIYEDDSRSAIVGLTESGISYVKANNNELTIPAGVTAVRQGAFSNFSSYGAVLNTLIVEGNPYFEKAYENRSSSLDENGDTSDGIQSNITTIQMGSNMSQKNMRALLLCLESRHSLGNVEISGGNVSSVKWTDDSIKAVLTSEVSVDLPATMVGSQVFGDAKVYGIFTSNYDYSTMCVGATFVDKDDGSNFLFYIPTKTVEGEKKVRFHRVHYINANAGILLHREKSTADRARLLRIDNVETYVNNLDDNAKGIYDGDQEKYKINMLVGSVSSQSITPTDGDYTNMILVGNLFQRTKAGTLGANKAYLKVPTSYLNGVSGAKLMISFDNETEGETTGIHSIENEKLTVDNENGAWYTLDGRKLVGKPTQKGVYIHDGTKVAIR